MHKRYLAFTEIDLGAAGLGFSKANHVSQDPQRADGNGVLDDYSFKVR